MIYPLVYYYVIYFWQLMKLTFLEFPQFTKWIKEVGNDEVLRELQNELMAQPDKGEVIVGSGGMRKIRVRLPGRGKSGGARAIYMHLQQSDTIVLVTIYTKADKTDLTPKEKKIMRLLSAEIKEGSI